MNVTKIIHRIELYVILCCEDVYNQEIRGTTIVPNIPYEEVSIIFNSFNPLFAFCLQNYAIVLITLYIYIYIYIYDKLYPMCTICFSFRDVVIVQR